MYITAVSFKESSTEWEILKHNIKVMFICITSYNGGKSKSAGNWILCTKEVDH